METKKRSRPTSDAVTSPSSSSASLASSNSTSNGSHIRDYDSGPNKRPKLEEPARSRAEIILERALASLGVEPESSVVPTSHSSSFKPIIGREAECLQIESHCRANFEKGEPRPLYVCGTPGSGKTASVAKIMRFSTDIKNDGDNGPSHLAPYCVRVNCATDLLGTASAAIYTVLYDRIVEAFDSSIIASTLKVSMKDIKPTGAKEQEYFPSLLQRINDCHLKYLQQTSPVSKKPLFILVLLDEIDHLLISKSTFNTELHFLFSSWAEPWGILSIVAISNTHDLFERHLPLLRTVSAATKDTGESVKIVQFRPYTAEQLELVLASRIGFKSATSIESASDDDPSLQPTIQNLFDSKALKFFTGKVAKLAGDQAGDARILIDLSKSAIIAAIQANKLPITIDVVAKVWRQKMTSPVVDPIAALTLIQKVGLLCMVVSTQNASAESSEVRPTALEATWKALAQKLFFAAPPPLSELWGAISLLEGIGHIRILSEKGNRKSYQLVSREKVVESLKKEVLFSEFLE